jgi:hypothetical protein
LSPILHLHGDRNDHPNSVRPEGTFGGRSRRRDRRFAWDSFRCYLPHKRPRCTNFHDMSLGQARSFGLRFSVSASAAATGARSGNRRSPPNWCEEREFLRELLRRRCRRSSPCGCDAVQRSGGYSRKLGYAIPFTASAARNTN